MKVLLSILSLILPAFINAQEIKGKITDSMKHPIPDVKVIVRQNGVVTSKNNTDSCGKYILSVVNPGYYNLTASKRGLQTVTILKLIVAPNGKTTQNFTLMTARFHKGILRKQYVKPWCCDGEQRRALRAQGLLK